MDRLMKSRWERKNMVCKKRMRLFGFVGVLLTASVLLSACGSASEPSPSAASSGQTSTITAPTVVSLDIKTLLTVDEVAQVIGQAVGEAEEYDEGTTLRFPVEGSLDQYVDFLLLDADQAAFDDMLTNFSDLTEAPNLGKAAWWQAELKTLLVFQGSYMISIIPNLDEKEDTLLIMARELASKVLERL